MVDMTEVTDSHENAEPIDGGRPELIAYAIGGRATMPIVPAPLGRDWMAATSERFAHRCLPLLMANQSGWHILNSHAFRVEWDGGDHTDSLRIIYLSGDSPYPATSTFGYGIVTFAIPYVFRTPPGYNLLARGPANAPKDAISALEGLVESDWAVATFTMNWKLTRPNEVVTFAEGEPVCQIVPQRRGELEEFAPRIEAIESRAELHTQHQRWATSRQAFIAHQRMRVRRVGRSLWQRHYFHGTSPGGASATKHQSRLRLRPFGQQHNDGSG